MNLPLGICSWSLKNNPFEIVQTLENTGLRRLHLDLASAHLLWPFVEDYAWTVSATMLSFPQEDYSSLDRIRETGGIVPDECWSVNRTLLLDGIEKTAERGVPYLSFHAGFMDHTDADPYAVFCARICEVADVARTHGIMLLLETGQETAEDLKHFLETINHPSLGVNFDPANMILYDKGDPVAAVMTLGPWIQHVHIKDALKTTTPGEWGAEVPWGDGDVDGPSFFQALEKIGYAGALAIEREAGDARRTDIQIAVERLGGGK